MRARTPWSAAGNLHRGKSLGAAVRAFTLVMGWPLALWALPLSSGDVLVGLGSSAQLGAVRHFAPDGTLLETLVTTSGSFEETGMCVDPARTLYTTNFEANSMSTFDATGALSHASFGSGFNEHPNSCIVDAAGRIYVGLSDTDQGFGGGGVIQLDAAGTPLATFSPAPDGRGTDSVDLAADQCTLVYTSTGASIKMLDLCTNAQLSNFCSACDDGAGGATQGPMYGVRLLPDGGLLVADWNQGQGTGLVRRYDQGGTQIAAYSVADALGLQCGTDATGPCFFPWSLALDPDRTSFWVTDFLTGEVFKLALADGAVLSQFFAWNCMGADAPCNVTGLAVMGEPTAATAGPVTTTVTGSITAANKTYDGGRAASITCVLSGVADGDVVGCTATDGAFATASPGNGKVVTASISLTGANASKYVLAASSVTAFANIAPAPVTASITTASKIYDGTLLASVTNCSLDGVVGAEPVSCTATGASFASAGAGSSKAVTATISLAGAASTNYVLSSPTATAFASIGQKPASVTPTATGKTYGSVDPPLMGTLSGFLAADGVTAVFGRTAGEGVGGNPYTISATLSPAAALANYAIAYGTAAFTITPATPVVTWADPASITYPTPLGGTQLNATASVPGTFAYTPPAGTVLNVGDAQPLSVLFSPSDGSNYTTASAQVHISVVAASASCPGDPSATLTRAVDQTGAAHGSVPVYATLQGAYNAAHNGDVIGMFGKTVENVTLGGSKSLTITECTTARITAANSNQPVWNITSTGALMITGPAAVGGTIGWRIATGNHTIKSVRSTGASQYGVLILGDNNSVGFNSVSGSTVGIRVTGRGNDLPPGGNVTGNSDNGVELGSAASGNTVRLSNVESNGRNGIQIDGSSNAVTIDGHVDDNGLNGILVNGDNNLIKGNSVGSRGDGNTKAGIKVAGDGNTLDSNSANANGGVGFDIAGTGNTLKNTQSDQSPGGNKENAGCEYRFANNTTLDQGGNKKDTLSFVGQLPGPRYAAGCYE